MALEAARQLSDHRDSNADLIRLYDVKLKQNLPLSVFLGADTTVEAHLVARQMDRFDRFTFEIFSSNAADEKSWARHCTGIFETQSTVESSNLNVEDQPHDQTLINQAQVLEPNIGDHLTYFTLSLEGSSGEFRCNVDDFDTYAVDPLVLNSIIRLPPMTLLGRNLPAQFHLSSLASITAPIRPQRSNCGRFTTRVKSTGLCHAESDIEIRQSENVISLKGLRYRATKVIHEKPALNSLFFKPILLPDVTKFSAALSMGISRCAELLTHKWPMCDIKILKVPERCTLSILEAFDVAGDRARSYFRSIKCSSLPQGIVLDRVQLVDGSDESSKYHMIITQEAPSGVQLSDQLHNGGLLCIPRAYMHDLDPNQSASYEIVCNISGLDLDPWVLLHKATGPHSACAGRRAVIFASQQGLPSLNSFDTVESVPLEPAAAMRFCERNNFERFDAIIIDRPEKSVIITWLGDELMPWLQCLLKSANSILWVTGNWHKTPYANVAGSLLRTLQSEQPSLKISWLVIDETANMDPGTFAWQIEQAFVRMVEGEDELVRTIGGSEEKILRYVPDDRLSDDTGLGLPRRIRDPLGEADYTLGFAAPGEPVILSSKASSTQSLSDDTIDVLVEASVVDTDDLQRFHIETEAFRPQSGLFFAGRVLNSRDSDFPPECRVVGWHPDHVHRKKLSVQSYDVYRYSSPRQPSQAASGYAAIAVACCIVDGTARARPGETFLLKIQGLLSDAVKQVCEHLGALVLSPCSRSKADFLVTPHGYESILVNERPIDFASYIQSKHGRAMVQRSWQELADPLWQVDEYEIADYKEAFHTTKQPYATVLLHRNVAKIADHVPIYNQAAELFMDHVSYIVIGGLGGLGRFICSWMIENGAKHITAISRSGAGTLEARDALSAMNAYGSFVQCIKADACDRKAISELISKLRSERPIKGVINLAMVLGDAPMATMTAEEWDRGLRVKIDSSWILHEETLQDRLDFFILFSSIASVLGNRSQGNYNVANSFLNALAEYRQSLDLPGISVALGAMSKSANLCMAIHRDRCFC